MAGPIRGREIHAPEMWRWRKKFHSDALAFLRHIAQIHDAAFLLFFGGGIDQDEVRAHLQRLVQIQKAAMGIDDDGPAVLAELPALGVASGRTDWDPREHA
jgi:predicted dehydrogenase